ncbi:MAG: 3-oxoacyl-ACP synthase [Frankiales bacterium]|nr:3-oxoacyl-ACP synthase [Frankiales bacterium]
MTALRHAAITGLGAHRPERRDDNHGVSERIGSSDEWIRERSGIVTRGVAAKDESVVEMAIGAGGKALAAAGVDPSAVSLVLLATCTMPGPLPPGAPAVAHGLGATRAGASDINAACAGFTYGLSLAADAVRAGSADVVLVIGSEKLLDYVDPYDRGTAFLFGDGAGAAVVTTTDGPDTIGPVVWQHEGASAAMLDIYGEPGSPQYLHMDGRGIYRWATGALPGIAREACERAGIQLSELKAFVPHQANLRITMSVVKSLGLADSVVIAKDIVDSGNTSGASVPLALARLVEQGELSTGDPVLLIGFGAGLTAAGQVIRCP